MKYLQDISLVCVDCVSAQDAIKSMIKSMKLVRFEKNILFTSKLDSMKISCGKEGIIEIINIHPINNMTEYCYFVMKELGTYIKDEFSHILLVQSDSWVEKPEIWAEEFLQYDYLGAPLIAHYNTVVQNGGFSLRSKKLCKFLSESPEILDFQDDVSICETYRNLLIYNGFKFAPKKLAEKFSREGSLGDINGTFGQHSCGNGLYAGFDYHTGRKRFCWISPPKKIFPIATEKYPDEWAYQIPNAIDLIDYKLTKEIYEEWKISLPEIPYK